MPSPGHKEHHADGGVEMKEFGVSLYPGRASLDENKAYLDLAGRYGCTRVFTCLISMKGEKMREEFAHLAGYAKTLGMQVIADVSPKIFTDLNITCDDLSFFSRLNLSGIRLDLGFSGHEESVMTFNPYGLKIILNMSSGTKYLDNILCFNPKKENILGCHNFYPHRYTGLSREHFLRCSRQFKDKGIRTAAFVSSRTATYGPWEVSEGLCTLEEHRHLPVDVQAKDLFNTNLIDDCYISNCFASEAEFKALSHLDRDILTLNIELNKNVPEVERKIILDELHFNRGDISAYMIRSTQSRVKYGQQHFPLFNAPHIHRGDVLIESSLYDRYAGELQIALQEMSNSGKTNVVGKVAGDEIYLLDNIRPWQKFKFQLK